LLLLSLLLLLLPAIFLDYTIERTDPPSSSSVRLFFFRLLAQCRHEREREFRAVRRPENSVLPKNQYRIIISTPPPISLFGLSLSLSLRSPWLARLLLATAGTKQYRSSQQPSQASKSQKRAQGKQKHARPYSILLRRWGQFYFCRPRWRGPRTLCAWLWRHM